MSRSLSPGWVPAARTVLAVATALAALVVIPWVAMDLGLLAGTALAGLDPDGAFVYGIVHKIAMTMLALALMAAMRRPRAHWGLVLGDWRAMVRIVAVFAAIVTALSIVVDGLPYLLSHTQPPINFWPTPLNIAGVLVFQWVVVGIGEELFFRGLILGLLTPVLGRRVRLGFFSGSVAGLGTAVLFGIAHGIYYDPTAPWLITWDPTWVQVAYATLLGVYYAALRERTGSLLGPMLSHGISDGAMWVIIFLAIAAAS